MANVFISHRKLDTDAAERLARDVQRAGHSVWFDEWRIDVCDSIVARVEEGLTGAHYLILCFSSSGMSDWVNREWMSTLARQLSGHNVKVLPVLLTGGKPPAILADIKFADLVADWDKGVQAVLKAIR
jgi:TIR domain